MSNIHQYADAVCMKESPPISLLQDAFQVRESIAILYGRQPVMTDNPIHLFLGLGIYAWVQNHAQDEAVHNTFRLTRPQDM